MIKNKDKIYNIFFETKEDKLYYNQLKELTKLSYSSLQVVLEKLIINNEIKKIKTKSNTFYSLTNKEKSIEFTKITYHNIDKLNINVKTPVKEFLKMSPDEIHTIILFGSASNNQMKKGSDIDLLVVLNSYDNPELQKLYEEEIISKFENIAKEINTRTIYPISLFFTNKEEFENSKDHVINEAKLKGFPIKNQLIYYENEN